MITTLQVMGSNMGGIPKNRPRLADVRAGNAIVIVISPSIPATPHLDGFPVCSGCLPGSGLSNLKGFLGLTLSAT
jgi:hypothetical protein